MTLASGTKLGPYEILSAIGAGGMGEVYRAKDSRLGREVAVKVLPETASLDKDRLSRFEREARSASALNHPNIITIYEIGQAEHVAFIVMELVAGRTLRDLCAAEPLPVRRAIGIAVQIAEGLAKAHAAGIVHRDLKPENLMVSRDGYVKILDFGLAKLAEPDSGDVSAMPTQAGPGTHPGVVLGTVGYMSPEQASGHPLDFRSDQFSLGSILYEITSGRRAFSRKTAAETMSAIIREEPEPLARLRPEVPPPLRWIVERCLAKDPEERYASTRDLARDLAMHRDYLAESGASEPIGARPRRRRTLFLVGGLLAAGGAGALAGFLLLRTSLESKPPPSYHQLTFRQGTVRSARFSPDGQTVVYAAAWGGRPLEVFAVRPGAPESRSLGQLGANELAVSPSGEIALVIRNRFLGLFPGFGTLARMPFEGGASPREALEDVSFADWSPDGAAMAVVRQAGSLQRLEYPIGKILYETAGWISHPRVSPDGLRVAFLDHPIPGDDRGRVAIADRAGWKTLGGIWGSVQGVAWPPDGREIWFTAAKSGWRRELRALSLSGKERLVAPGLAAVTLFDISRNGRVLLVHDNVRFGTLAVPPGGTQERELSWLDSGLVNDISPDGQKILLNEFGEGGGEGYSIYLRGTDGSPAVRLGSGSNPRFSPDGKWVLTADIRTEPPQLVLLPTGPGEPVSVTRDRLEHFDGQFFPDGKRIVFAAGEAGQGRRLYVQTISGGTPASISSAGIRGSVEGQGIGPVSPDSQFVAARNPDGRLHLYPTSPGDSLPISGVADGEFPIQWSHDAKFLYVRGPGELPARVFRVNPLSGERELWKQFAPSDPIGVVAVQGVVMTPDAAAYAYSYVRILSELFVVDGLR